MEADPLALGAALALALALALDAAELDLLDLQLVTTSSAHSTTAKRQAQRPTGGRRELGRRRMAAENERRSLMGGHRETR